MSKKTGAASFLRELERGTDPSVRDRKMTFREALRIIDVFADGAQLGAHNLSDRETLIFLESAGLDPERAVEIRERYLGLELGTG